MRATTLCWYAIAKRDHAGRRRVTGEMRVRRGIGSALAASAAALLLALPVCAQQPDPVSASPEVDRTTGAYFYARYCAACHGRDGRGTLVGFPLVERPSGPVTLELLLESLRTPLQLMPSFPRAFINTAVPPPISSPT